MISDDAVNNTYMKPYVAESHCSEPSVTVETRTNKKRAIVQTTAVTVYDIMASVDVTLRPGSRRYTTHDHYLTDTQIHI